MYMYTRVCIYIHMRIQTDIYIHVHIPMCRFKAMYVHAHKSDLLKSTKETYKRDL